MTRAKYYYSPCGVCGGQRFWDQPILGCKTPDCKGSISYKRTHTGEWGHVRAHYNHIPPSGDGGSFDNVVKLLEL